MRIERFLLVGRSALVICTFSLAAMAVGCSEGGDSGAPAPGTANTQEQQDKERAARESAYGKGGNTKSAAGDASSNTTKSKAGSTGSKPN
jgi:hypothetical protein